MSHRNRSKSKEQKQMLSQKDGSGKVSAGDPFESLFQSFDSPKVYIEPSIPILRVGWVLLRKKNYTGIAPLKQWTPYWAVLIHKTDTEDTRALLRLFDSPEAFDASIVIDTGDIKEVLTHSTSKEKLIPGFCLSMRMSQTNELVTLSLRSQVSQSRWLNRLIHVAHTEPIAEPLSV